MHVWCNNLLFHQYLNTWISACFVYAQILNNQLLKIKNHQWGVLRVNRRVVPLISPFKYCIMFRSAVCTVCTVFVHANICLLRLFNQRADSTRPCFHCETGNHQTAPVNPRLPRFDRSVYPSSTHFNQNTPNGTQTGMVYDVLSILASNANVMNITDKECME